jgi:transcription initiation factor IIF auxiliary subunit
MYRYVFIYEPVWGCFTRMVEYVFANNQEQAKIKFYLTEAGDNCNRIIDFYRG